MGSRSIHLNNFVINNTIINPYPCKPSLHGAIFSYCHSLSPTRLRQICPTSPTSASSEQKTTSTFRCHPESPFDFSIVPASSPCNTRKPTAAMASASKRSRRRRKQARKRRVSADDDPQGKAHASAQRSPYRHESLPDREKFFRLLELLPGKWGSPVCCRLRTYSINFHPDYDAISYVWGEEWDRVYIFCHRKRLLVPQNLSDVLQRLRYQERSRILWADSVCIDQSNDDERGHQVQLMRAIFRQVHNVNAWLGRGANFDVDTAFQLIEYLYGAWSRDFPRETVTQQISNYQWTQLSKLLRSSWFRRVWVVQEVGLASNAFLICGSNEMRWMELARPNRWIRYHFHHLLDEHRINLKRVDRMNLNFREGKSEDIRTILEAAKYRICSDPRDKIYAILGHIAFTRLKKVTDGTICIFVDYSKPVSGLYLDVAIKLLELPNPYLILSLVEHTDSTINDSCEASWVPQWVSYHDALTFADFKNSTAFYGACVSRTPEFEIDNKTLGLKGICLDRIKRSSSKFDLLDSAEKIDSTTRSVWEELIWPEDGCHGSFDKIVFEVCSTILAGIRSNLTDSCWTVRDIHEHVADLMAYIHRIGIDSHVRDTLSKEHRGVAEQFVKDIKSGTAHERCFFIGENGCFGLGPPILQPGDEIFFLLGAQVPFILRSQHHTGEYRLCGEC